MKELSSKVSNWSTELMAYSLAPHPKKRKDDKYYDSVILPKEQKDLLNKMAIDEYNKLKGSGNSAKSENDPF